MLDTPQNPLWKSDVGRKPPPNLRRSHPGGKILKQPTLFLLVLVTFLANAAKAVDYLEEWEEEEETDVSQNARLRFSILKVTCSFI